MTDSRVTMQSNQTLPFKPHAQPATSHLEEAECSGKRLRLSDYQSTIGSSFQDDAEGGVGEGHSRTQYLLLVLCCYLDETQWQ